MSDQTIGLPKQTVSAESARADSKLNGSNSPAHLNMAEQHTTPLLTSFTSQLAFAQFEKLPDEELIIHLGHSHPDALAVLFDRYHRLVLSVVSKILRDLGEAEDVTQAVFLEIYRAAPQFNPAKGSAKVWILQYAYHRSLNRRQYLRLRQLYHREQIARLNLPTSSSNGTPWGSFSPQEAAYLVRQALGNLNGAQRATIELVYFHGLSMKEIAKRRRESLVSVRHNYYRGLKKLRTVLGQRVGSADRDGKQVQARGEVVDVNA